jgi:hypothetical protein
VVVALAVVVLLKDNLTQAILFKCHTGASQCVVEIAYTSILP